MAWTRRSAGTTALACRRPHVYVRSPAEATFRTEAYYGEVYEADAVTLAALDRLEGRPRFYRRRPIRPDDGDEVQANLFSRSPLRGNSDIPGSHWPDANPKENWP